MSDGLSASLAEGANQSASKPASSASDKAFVGRAEGVCQHSLEATHALGRKLPQILAGSSFPQEAVTSGLVKPGVAILSGEAAQMRALGTPASDALETYVGLFEPIVELGYQRLDVEPGEVGREHRLEQLIVGLENKQSAIARRFGLKACAISFNRALAQSG